jgi:secondary thiamine-phosphate synthase enzyme
MPMRILTHRLLVATSRPIEILDITAPVREWVRASGVLQGLLTVMSPHTTARITLNEREAELQEDMIRWLEQLAPADAPYGHNRAPVDDRLNAHAHLLGLFVNASETIPVRNGDLELGGWQALFFIELDGPRMEREVKLHLLQVE